MPRRFRYPRLWRGKYRDQFVGAVDVDNKPDLSPEGGEQFATGAERDAYERRYPLHPDEVKRRALVDARAAELALGSIARTRAPEGCAVCGGRGQVVTPGGTAMKPCPECNGPAPGYPGMVPGGLAERAYSGALSGTVSRSWREGGYALTPDAEARDEASRAFWRAYKASAAEQTPVRDVSERNGRPVVDVGVMHMHQGRRFGLEGLHCSGCGSRRPLPPGAWCMSAAELAGFEVCECGGRVLAVFAPRLKKPGSEA